MRNEIKIVDQGIGAKDRWHLELYQGNVKLESSFAATAAEVTARVSTWLGIIESGT